MKRMYFASWLSVGLLISGGLFAGTPDQPLHVQHDPFQKPARLQVRINSAVAANSQAPQASEFNLASLAMTAVLQAGNNSMVILAGKTLQLGDVFEGYRLVEIRERSAVFNKDQKLIELKIDKADVDK